MAVRRRFKRAVRRASRRYGAGAKRRRMQVVGPYRGRGARNGDVGRYGPYHRVAGGMLKEGGKQLMKYGKRKYNDWKNRPRKVPRGERQAGGSFHTLTKSSKSFGSRRKMSVKRCSRQAYAGAVKLVQHHQGVTNFDTTAGFFPLANRHDSTTNEVKLPMNGIDPNQFVINGRVGEEPVHYSFGWSDTTSAANIVRVALQGQNPSCDAATTLWENERNYLGVNFAPVSNNGITEVVNHEWIAMKLNLYGARIRSTTFQIDFIRFLDDDANFFLPVNSTSSKAKEALEYMSAPLTYSNLVKREVNAKRYIQFVKSDKHVIAPEDSTDLNTSSGKLKEVNIFYNRNRFLNMIRHEPFQYDAGTAVNLPLAHAQADGADYQVNLVPDKETKLKSRIYIIIRAFSPDRRSSTTVQWGTLTGPFSYITNSIYGGIATVNTEPSYDLIIRNKYSFTPAMNWASSLIP